MNYHHLNDVLQSRGGVNPLPVRSGNESQRAGINPAPTITPRFTMPLRVTICPDGRIFTLNSSNPGLLNARYRSLVLGTIC